MARPALVENQLQIAQARLKPIVVKLGGSVVRSGELDAWLDAIAAAPGPVVLVPGGGALADEVRDMQHRLGFGDIAAHRMALMAMDQLALAVGSLRAGFRVCESEDDLQGALRERQIAVWAPSRLVAGRIDIPPSWTITSDSLALWLASRLGAERLFLIKSIQRNGKAASAASLARDGIIDEAFPAILSELRLPVFLLGRGDQASWAESLAAGAPCGMAVDSGGH